MRTFQTYETHFHLEKTDPRVPEIMHQWGRLKRRIRVQPTALRVTWERATDQVDWRCKEVVIFGDQVHQRTSNYVGIYFVGGHRQASSTGTDPMPSWAANLVASSYPDARLIATEAVMDQIVTDLGKAMTS